MGANEERPDGHTTRAQIPCPALPQILPARGDSQKIGPRGRQDSAPNTRFRQERIGQFIPADTSTDNAEEDAPAADGGEFQGRIEESVSS